VLQSFADDRIKSEKEKLERALADDEGAWAEYVQQYGGGSVMGLLAETCQSPPAWLPSRTTSKLFCALLISSTSRQRQTAITLWCTVSPFTHICLLMTMLLSAQPVYTWTCQPCAGAVVWGPKLLQLLPFPTLK
jgi:hypothetical protein